MVIPKHTFQTTTGSVDLAGATIKIVHHALLEMSHLVEDKKIFQLCGSQDQSCGATTYGVSFPHGKIC